MEHVLLVHQGIIFLERHVNHVLLKCQIVLFVRVHQNVQPVSMDHSLKVLPNVHFVRQKLIVLPVQQQQTSVSHVTRIFIQKIQNVIHVQTKDVVSVIQRRELVLNVQLGIIFLEQHV